MSGAIDPVNVIYKFKRTMQEQLDALVQTLANGGIDSMDAVSYTHLTLPTNSSV